MRHASRVLLLAALVIGSLAPAARAWPDDDTAPEATAPAGAEGTEPTPAAPEGQALPGLDDEQPDHGGKDSLWSVRVLAAYRFFSGTTRVREFFSVPDHLSFSRELGLRRGLGIHAEAFYDGDWLHTGLELDYFGPSGRGSVDHPFRYDEGFFQAGNIRSNSSFFFLRWTATWKAARSDRYWVGPLLGLEYTEFGLGIKQGFSDQDTSESYRQFIPYPVVGLAGRVKLTDSLELDGRIFGIYFEHMPTFFREGGMQYMTARTFNAQAILSWSPLPHLRLCLGGTLLYFDGGLRSHEDGNVIRYWSPGILAGLELRF